MCPVQRGGGGYGETPSGKAASQIFQQEDHADVQRRIQQNLRLICFFSRNFRSISAEANQELAAFVFDSEGCLLCMEGAPALLDCLADRGIRVGTRWSEQTAGRNAVTQGLANSGPANSCGRENDCPALQEFALYYSPVVVKKGGLRGVSAPFETDGFGGVAFLVPAEQASGMLQLALSALTHGLAMTLHFNQTANMLYERNGQCLLTVDSRMFPGRNAISYCSSKLLSLLGVSKDPGLFAPVEELIDPLPSNLTFWEILRERRQVNEYPMTLQVRGKAVSCIVSTDAFHQPGLDTSGVRFLITTPQQESSRISAKMANNALLSFDDIVGRAPVIKSAIQRGRLLAQNDSNIMILGESGTGKDVFAQAIHNASLRRNKPFIAVNCGSLPRELIASELFGYTTGAFTGAKRQGNIGKFELANGGTIFLDEIGELPLDLQANLLRVVEQKQFMRLGGTEYINLDVKIISATNADIPEMIAKKQFRADLYYRLGAMRLNLPPLRERGEDVLLLSRYFIDIISRRIGRPEPVTLLPETERLLLSLPWSGNIRELQNLLDCVVQLYPDQAVTPQHILDNIVQSGHPLPPPAAYVDENTTAAVSELQYSVRKKCRRLSREALNEALTICGDNRSMAAAYLGISRNTLYRYLREYQL